MSRPPPFPGLPVRRRSRINWGIVCAIMAAFVAVGLIINAVRSMQAPKSSEKVGEKRAILKDTETTFAPLGTFDGGGKLKDQGEPRVPQRPQG